MNRSTTPSSVSSGGNHKKMKGAEISGAASWKQQPVQELCPHHSVTEGLKRTLWRAVATAEEDGCQIHDKLLLCGGEIFCVVCDNFVFHSETDAVRIHALFELKRRLVTAAKASSTELIPKTSIVLPAGLGLCGLVNLGNTCFMNSILQVLLHNTGIREYMLSGRHRVECGAAGAASRLVHIGDNSLPPAGNSSPTTTPAAESNANRYAQCWKRPWSEDKEIASSVGDLKLATTSDVPACFGCELECLAGAMCCPAGSVGVPITAHRMLQNLWSFSPVLAGYYQQDAQEFYSTLINAVHAHMCNTSSLSSSSGINNPTSSEPSGQSRNHEAAADHTTETEPSGDNGSNTCVTEPTSPSSANQRDGSLACGCLVHNELGGVLRSQLVCEVCRNSSSRYEPFFDLPLDVSSSSTSLQDCLEAFISSETLQGVSCSSCDQPRSMSKRLSIHVLPPTLVFHLKRFQSSVTSSNNNASQSLPSSSSSSSQTSSFSAINGIPKLEKNTMEVAFPAEGLDLSPYVSTPCFCYPGSWSGDTKGDNSNSNGHPDSDGPSKSKRCECYQYRLRAVVQHKGQLAGGHYIAYVRYDCELDEEAEEAAKMDLWFRFDDAMVHRVEVEEVLSSEAYMLFYSRSPSALNRLR